MEMLGFSWVNRRKVSLFVAILYGFMGSLEATNGVFLIGYGAQSKAMGGVSIALPQEALVALTNPAGMVHLGDRMDIGVSYLYNAYWEDISENRFGKNGRANLNTLPSAGLMEAGYNKMRNECCSLGITMAPLAGGIVHHAKRASDTPGEGPHRIEVAYGALSPCFSGKIGECQSIGVSVDLVLAAVRIRGLESIQNRDGSAFPGHVTNNGFDYAPGLRGRIGWLSQVGNCLWVGAAYCSQTFMRPFNKYKGLFTPEGRVNLPARYDLGIAYRPNCTTTFALDVGKVLYSQIRTWSGPKFDRSRPLWGASKGPGLGWKDQYIVKFGAAKQISLSCSSLTGRVGLNYGDPPIPRSRTNDNNNTPATTQWHLTAGATWTTCCSQEWTLVYVAGLRHAIQGTDDSIVPAAGGGRSNLSSLTHELEIGYGWCF